MTTSPYTEAGMKDLLCGSCWAARPPGGFDYDSHMAELAFGQQKASVTLACGQTMYFNAECRYELLTPTTLQLIYDSAPACLHRSATFTPGFTLTIPFKLESGDFSATENRLSSDFKSRWRWCLRFERHPYPDGIFFPLAIPKDFYGYVEGN